MQIESNFMRSMRSVATDCRSHKGWDRGKVVSSSRRKGAVLWRPLLVNTLIRPSKVWGVLQWLFCSLLSLFIVGWCLQSTGRGPGWSHLVWSLYRPETVHTHPPLPGPAPASQHQAPRHLLPGAHQQEEGCEGDLLMSRAGMLVLAVGRLVYVYSCTVSQDLVSGLSLPERSSWDVLLLLLPGFSTSLDDSMSWCSDLLW